MLIRKSGNLVTYHFSNLSKQKDLIHFVSSRVGGVSNPPYSTLNLSLCTGDTYKDVIRNRRQLFGSFRIPLRRATFANQRHTSNVKIITKEMRGSGVLSYKSGIDNTDAMLTNQPDICLVVLTADCVPIILYDQKKKVIGVVHSGWKGTASKIVTKTIHLMFDEFISKPEDILVGIGPSIGPENYEVGMDVIKVIRKSFPKYELIRKVSKEKGLLNLWEANFRQLISAGVSRSNIELARICTYQNSNMFYSYRKGHPTGLFGTGVMLKT